MIRSAAVLAIASMVAAVVLSDATVDEPMVAFVCNRPAMHSSNRGWVRDETTSCIKDPIEILNYCRKVYPERDVWNVVESSETITIRNWCNFGHSKCRHRFNVRPFRCLVGAFQSEALQVPEHCVFDHLHGPGTTGGPDCQASAHWNHTARQACNDRHGRAQLHGFAVLQPCGIDGFAGVEFVCCPASVAASTPTNAALPSVGRHHVRRTTRSNVVKSEMTSTAAVRPTTKAATVPTTTITTTVATTTVAEQTTMAVHEDVDNVDDDVTDDEEGRPAAVAGGAESSESVIGEHDRFLKAKTELERRHHEKVSKMMREWAAARKRVQEIKNIDSKGGEKFNREMTARFQKAYEALERETAAERKKLVSEHQLRVEDSLSNKKSQAMDAYLAALNNPRTEATKVLNALVQYVKAEQKDRVHTINHYERVEESDPVEAESQRASVAAHLRGIDERVTQAIEMLSRLPKYEKKIRQQIEKFLSSYQSLDESLAVIMAKINEKSNENHAAPSKPAQGQQQEQERGPLVSPQQPTTAASVTGTQRDDMFTTILTYDTDDDTVASEMSTEGAKRTTFSAATSADKEPTTKMATMTTTEQSVTEQRHFVEVKPIVEHVAHNQKSDLTALENYIKKLPIRADSTGHLTAPLAIVVCGIAVFAVALVGVVLVRRRMVTGRPTPDAAACSRGVTEIDRAVRPSAAAVTDPRVPINGYENPTYQYYVQADAAVTPTDAR